MARKRVEADRRPIVVGRGALRPGRAAQRGEHPALLHVDASVDVRGGGVVADRDAVGVDRHALPGPAAAHRRERRGAVVIDNQRVWMAEVRRIEGDLLIATYHAA